MSRKIQEAVNSLAKTGDYAFVSDTIFVVKTGDNEYSVTDNGEEVSNLTVSDAARVIAENLDE